MILIYNHGYINIQFKQIVYSRIDIYNMDTDGRRYTLHRKSLNWMEILSAGVKF